MNRMKKLEIRLENIKKEMGKNEKNISELTQKNNNLGIEYKKLEKIYSRYLELQNEIDDVFSTKNNESEVEKNNNE